MRQYFQPLVKLANYLNYRENSVQLVYTEISNFFTLENPKQNLLGNSES